MTGRAVFLPGTLCDARVFGLLQHSLEGARINNIATYGDATDAARHLVGTVEPETLGVAFSLGSWVLLEMARLAPERFRGIVLISGNAFPDASENAISRRDRVTRGRESGFNAVFAEEWDRMLGPQHRTNTALRSLIVEMAEAVGHERHALQTEMNINRPDLRAFAARARVPIHVIAGSADGLCPRDRYEQAASGPDSTLTVLDGVGHYVPLEAPAVLAAHLYRLFPDYVA
ncbi:alpha/beta fold hydrolase [Novosphingobium tardum]|uniref:Alpha/beta fold hydrolase n=1 Tax=Novosphingobium tardum TaxID=1538021 RepID=A0ABV8RUN4_9SPHN